MPEADSAHCCCLQARVNPKTESPIIATIITGVIIGTLAFFVPLEVLADLVSMG
jgi:amino acid transporter